MVRRFVLLGLILLVTVGCDRAAKVIAEDALAGAPTISLLGGIVLLEYAENPGAFLGLGATLPRPVRFLLLVVVGGVSLVLALVYIGKMHGADLMPLIALSLLAGGSIGNLIDRVFNDGLVVDFVSIGIGPLRTGIFNLADVAVMAGVVILLVWSLGDRYVQGGG